MISPALKMAKDGVCVQCAGVEAYNAGLAPKLVLEATHDSLLELVPLDILMEFSA